MFMKSYPAASRDARSAESYLVVPTALQMADSGFYAEGCAKLEPDNEVSYGLPHRSVLQIS